jgi:hypothetical protein
MGADLRGANLKHAELEGATLVRHGPGQYERPRGPSPGGHLV